jgi:hypothetical protein
VRAPSLGALALGLALVLGAAPARAVGVSVEGGSKFFLGTGTLDLGCTDLSVAGTFSGESGDVDQARDVTIQPGGTLEAVWATLEVTGDWSNSGSFVGGTSRVNFRDGCGRTSATLSGSSVFWEMDITTSTGKAYAFESGSIQKVTGSLTLAGDPDAPLAISSTQDGVEAFLNLEGSQSISYVQVKDNHAIGELIVLDETSEIFGNTSGWIFGPAVPALTGLGLALVLLMLLWSGRRALRARAREAA